MKRDKLNKYLKGAFFWIWPLMGFFSLVWFLVRVIPKPSRATYPCQRAAFPIASGFVIWVTGLLGSALILKRAKNLFQKHKFATAAVCAMVAITLSMISLSSFQDSTTFADEPAEPHGALGVGKGIYPGRVVWVHDPEATNWDYVKTSETWNGIDTTGAGYWWQEDKTDQQVVDVMMADSITMLTGQPDITTAWDMLFRYFNIEQYGTDEGYTQGQKIMIKINMVTAHRGGSCDDDGNQVRQIGWVNTSPQMIVALLKQLVDVVGVAQIDITVGDTTCAFPRHYLDYCSASFPNVNYLAWQEKWGCKGAVSSKGTVWETPVYWSTENAEGFTQDYLPLSYAQASYLVNFACLKGHSAGVTLCAKNHYGSFIRMPDTGGYYNLHHSLPNAGWSPGFGQYRAHVDIMGHSQLGQKTLLYLIDGLYGGYYWHGRPGGRWQMPPFNNDWPGSLFASQDPVAIDSVAHDFLKNEWPGVVSSGGAANPNSLQGGAEDYLHEAAQADNPASGAFYDPDHYGNVTRLASLGTHEHWNNPVDKQYSRNLGLDYGIELVTKKTADINTDGAINIFDLMLMTDQWLSEPNNPAIDLFGDNFIDMLDLAELSNQWY